MSEVLGSLQDFKRAKYCRDENSAAEFLAVTKAAEFLAVNFLLRSYLEPSVLRTLCIPVMINLRSAKDLKIIDIVGILSEVMRLIWSVP